MKLRDLFWFATGATISYQLVKHREVDIRVKLRQ